MVNILTMQATIDSFIVVRADRQHVECIVVGATGMVADEIIDQMEAAVRTALTDLVAKGDEDVTAAIASGECVVTRLACNNGHPSMKCCIRVAGLDEIEDRVFLRESFAASLRKTFDDDCVMEAF